MLAIFIESPFEPIFYTSKRVGQMYQIFNLFKFRTMKKDSDRMVNDMIQLNKYQGETIFFKIDDDPRVTKVGKILRKTWIDELPQLLNVLKGDMSIVGNRPLPIYEAESIPEDAKDRFLAPAGMTGLWQINNYKKGSNISASKRMQMDVVYARYYNKNKLHIIDTNIAINTVTLFLKRLF